MTTTLRARLGRQFGQFRGTNQKLFLTLFAIASILQLPQAIPCNGSRTTTPSCGKTVVLTKVGPPGPILGAGIAGFFTYDVNLFATGSSFLPGPNCPQPIEATVDITLHCNPGPDSTGSSGPVAIGPGFTDIGVIIGIPAGPPRECQVSAVATVTFSDGSVVTSRCDADGNGGRGPSVCIVDAGGPGLARLDLERLTPPVLAVHAGDVGLHRYRIKNNDPNERFSGVLCVGSKNTSTIPEDTSGSGNVFGVSDPAGDAFGVYFADEIPQGVCPPLPRFPHRQIFREVKRRIVLAPGQEIVVDLMHRPYGGCATGSCGESRVRLEGLYTDLSPGLACTNAAVVVDNSLPPSFSCPGIGSIGRVLNINPDIKVADFQIFVQPPTPLGGQLPVQMQGAVSGFPGFQAQGFLTQEDNGESVRDITTISDPAGGLLPPGLVLDGRLSAQFADPSLSNEMFVSRMQLVEGAPTGVSHLAPVVKATLETFPLDQSPTPPALVEVMLQYGALGYPLGQTRPIPLPMTAQPDPEGNVNVRIVIPNGPPLISVELLCDVRMYGAARALEPPLPFQGNLVAPQGGAFIDHDLSRNQLVVSNIGSSGKDGVSIHLGDPENGTVVEFPQPLPLDPFNTQIGLQAFGVVEGVPNEQALGEVQILNLDPSTLEPVLFGDFRPFGARNILAQVYGNGRLVGTAILPPGGALGVIRPLDPNFGLPQLGGCGKFAPGFPYPLPCFFWDFDRLGSFNFPGRGPMIGDRVALFAVGSPLQLERVTALNLNAARIDPLFISRIGPEAAVRVGEDQVIADAIRRERLERRPADTPDHALNLFGHAHHPIGEAELHARGGHLTVSNIGSSGLDGVSIDLGEDGFEVTLDPPVNLRQPGSAFEVSALGTVGGTPGRALGSFGCQNNNGVVQAVADYKVLGVPNVEVRLSLGGVPQSTITVPCGVIGTVLPGPDGGFPQLRTCGKLSPIPLPCFFVETDRPILFSPPGAQPVLCDRVEALVPNLPEPLTQLSRFILRGTNLGVLGVGGESSPGPPQVEIVEPPIGRTGDIVIITGRGFDPDPDNNCAVVMMQGSQIAIPLEIVTASPTEMRARVGAMPPGTKGTGQVMVARGRGNRGFFEPAFPDVVVEEPVWVWDFTGLETPDGPTFQPVPGPPPPSTVWFEEPVIVEGELCLSFADPNDPRQPYAWPDPCKVQINARLRDHTDFFGYDQFASCIRFSNVSSPLECAERICDSIRCAWFQQAGIWVECRVEVDADTGIPSVYFGFADGIHRVDWGTFSVCVTALEEPVITEVDPPTGTTGDIVRVRGKGFGNCPDDLCMIVMLGDESVGVEVLAARDDLIIGRLGPIPPNPGPGQIMVGRGKGRRGQFQPVFPDILVEEPVWVWDFQGGETLEGFPFDPTFTPPPPEDMWFFSRAPVNGKLCVTIPRFDWDPECKLTISARMRDHASNRGHDNLSACIRFPNGGTFEECIERICDTIRCSWAQLAGIPIECTIDFTADSAVICIGFPPPFQVGWGNLTICIDCPDGPPPPPPIVTEVDRTEMAPGDILQIRGHEFGDDPDDLCVLLMDGNRSHSFNVDSFFDIFTDAGECRYRGALGPLPPDALAGPVMIGRGEGRRGQVIPIFDDMVFGPPPWGWRNDPRVEDTQGPDIVPRPAEPGVGEKWFHSLPPEQGVMCVYIDGNWGPESLVTISGRMRDHTTGKGYDQFASNIRITGPMPAFECARRICDAITCTWSQLAGVRVLCFASPVDNDRAKITLLFENGSIDWGNITICATDLTQLETLDEWKRRFGVVDDAEDLDFDGLPAILEAYLDLNPNEPDVMDALFDPAGAMWLRRNPTLTGVLATIEVSTDLRNYQTVAVNPPGGPSGDIHVFFLDLGLRGFGRVVVQRQ